MHIFLFGGTTEGRKIAEHIAEENIKREDQGREDFFETEVFVATDYGADLLPKDKHITVHVGRLDAEEMMEFFRTENSNSESSVNFKDLSVCDEQALIDKLTGYGTAGALVIDATHPYATVVTENIYKACKASGVRCIRVKRQNAYIDTENSDFLYFDNIKNAVRWLNSTFKNFPEKRKNILITTGSKEIQEYTAIPDYEEYCYVRALPTFEVIDKCMKLGFRRERLILMQGPFDVDMNLAQLRYASAGYIVTKDSGKIGGFSEKCDAAIELGVKMLVIGRPKEF